ncbi:ribosome biogenesis GTPase Der, partial [Candidatus Latescibacterota bacterium]
MSIPIVAIIGRPNVGKSTLFNRIIRKPLAITDKRPGVTRDRNAIEFEWNSRRFMLVDTGGFVISSRDTMALAVTEQSSLAIEEADVILFLVDVKSGITDLDNEVRNVLIKSKKPVVLGVNKVDGARDESDIYEFYNLGLGNPLPVSGRTGRGTGDLLDALVEVLPAEIVEADEGIDILKITLIGRPNVGKSSIVNSLTGENTVLVTETPGTTRDSIDTLLTVNGRNIILVDTAGLKRITKLKES